MTVSDLSVALDPATVRRTTLPNGLRVLVRRDVSAPVVAIVTYVSAGYFDETDDVVGIAHVLEHMYFKGTPTRGVGEIARQTKAVGGYLNAATIYDRARRAIRRVRQLADRLRRAGARARGDHPGGEAEGGQSRRRRDRDAVRGTARPTPHPSVAHRARARAAGIDARRDDALLPELLSPGEHGAHRRRRRRSRRRDVRDRVALRRAPSRRAVAHPGPRRRGGGGVPLSRVDGRHRPGTGCVRLAYAAHARRRAAGTRSARHDPRLGPRLAPLSQRA